MPRGYSARWEVKRGETAQVDSQVVEFVVRIEGEEPRVLASFNANDAVAAAEAVRVDRMPMRD